MFGLEFQRAAALFLLALPLILWLLARRPRPPRERATGTLAIWREVLDLAVATPASRCRGVPPGLYLLLLGLVSGTLALAGPRQSREAAPEWRVVLDTRANLFLPWRADGAEAGEQRRIDVALAAAREWIDGPALWMRFEDERWETERGVEPPAAWLRATNHPTAAPPWSEVDRADTLWITDRVPAAREASWSASGGERVDGVVGRRDGRLVSLLDGERVELGPASRVQLSVDPRLPRELAQLSASWARERGIALVEADADLRILTTTVRPGERVVSGEGWKLTGRAAEDARGRVLWRDAQGAAVLWTAPGELQLGMQGPCALEGDRRALGIAWIDALEAAAPPPPEAIPPLARRSAGAGGVRRGSGPGVAAGTEPGVLVTWLALAAALLGALGLRAGALRH